jgi:hypothetical protein
MVKFLHQKNSLQPCKETEIHKPPLVAAIDETKRQSNGVQDDSFRTAQA